MSDLFKNLLNITFIAALTLIIPVNGMAEGTPTNPPVTTAETTAPVKPLVAASAIKIGYINMSKISEESAMGKAALAKFKEKGDKAKAQVSAKEKQLEKQKKALEEKLPTLSPKERSAKAAEFEKKIEEYRKLVQGLEKEQKSLQQELTRAMYKQIEQTAVTYGKTKGFAVILEKQELLYLDNKVEVMDLTDEVLKLIE